MTRPSTKPNAMKPSRNCHDQSVSKPQIQPLTAAHTKSVRPPTNPSLPAESRDNVNRAWQDTQVNVLPLKSNRHLGYRARIAGTSACPSSASLAPRSAPPIPQDERGHRQDQQQRTVDERRPSAQSRAIAETAAVNTKPNSNDGAASTAPAQCPRAEGQKLTTPSTGGASSRTAAAAPSGAYWAISTRASPCRPSPAPTQIARGLRPGRELEGEALLHEPAGHDPAALEHQLGLAPEQPRADLQHPGGGGQAQPHPPRLAQRAHEVGVGQGMRRGEVDGAVDLVVLDQPIDGAHEVPVMSPRDVLPAVAGLAPEAEAHEAQQQVEHAAPVGAHHDGRAQRHLARAWRRRRVERALPRRAYADAEAPRVGRSGLGAAEDARGLVVGRVVAVRVDGGGAHLQPDARRPRRARDGLAEDARAVHARLLDGAPVVRRVAAVHAAPRQGDDHVRALELARPRPQALRVPPDHQPGRLLRRAAQHHDLVTVAVEGAGEDRADLARAAREEDFYGKSSSRTPRPAARASRASASRRRNSGWCSSR